MAGPLSVWEENQLRVFGGEFYCWGHHSGEQWDAQCSGPFHHALLLSAPFQQSREREWKGRKRESAGFDGCRFFFQLYRLETTQGLAVSRGSRRGRWRLQPRGRVDEAEKKYLQAHKWTQHLLVLEDETWGVYREKITVFFFFSRGKRQVSWEEGWLLDLFLLEEGRTKKTRRNDCA